MTDKPQITFTCRAKTDEEYEASCKAHPPKYPLTGADLELLRRVRETLE